MNVLTSAGPPVDCSPGSRVCLVNGPYVLEEGHRIPVPEGSKRLVVFVALHGGSVDRRYAAGSLWPCGAENRAAGNLRSALWRLRGAGIHCVAADKNRVELTPATAVDITVLYEWAARVIGGTADRADLSVLSWSPDLFELLPGWYDEWVVFERERLRQRFLHALECLSVDLAASGRHAEAVEAALLARNIEPLRESAHRALVAAHLSEGNWVEAQRAYQAYETLAARELGVRPTPALQALVGAFRGGPNGVRPVQRPT